MNDLAVWLCMAGGMMLFAVIIILVVDRIENFIEGKRQKSGGKIKK